MAIHGGVAQDDLDVIASLREGDGFDEFRDFVVGALRFPEGDAIFAGVVSSGSIFEPAGGTSEIGDIEHAELDIDVGIEERGFGVADFALLGENPAGLGKNLHEANGVGVRNNIGLEGGFLANEAGGEHRIKIVAFRFAAQRGLVREREQNFPDAHGDFVELTRFETRNGQAPIVHARGEMALIESGLRGFDQKSRRIGGGEGGLEFEFGGSVEANRAEGLGAIPAISNAGGNRLVEGTQQRRRGNLREDISEIFFTGAKRFEAQGSVLSKIGGGETLRGFAIEGARVGRIAAALGFAAQPVESVVSAAREWDTCGGKR